MKRVAKQQRLARAASVALLTVLAAALVYGAGRYLEWRVGLTLLYQFRGVEPPPPGAVIISVSDTDIRDLQFELRRGDRKADICGGPERRAELLNVRGVGDLPRWYYACIIEHLTELSAASIVMDVHFRLRRDEAGDAALIEALRVAEDVMILEAVRFLADGGAVERSPPHADFAAAARTTGFFVIEHSRGRPTRRLTRIAGAPSLCALPDVASGGVCDPSATPGQDAYAWFWLYGPGGTVPRISSGALFLGDADAPLVAGAVAFIGLAAEAGVATDMFSDAWPGRGGQSISGVELLATSYLNTTNGGPLRPLDEATFHLMLIGYALVFGALAAGRRRWRAAAIVALAAACVVVAATAFQNARLWLPVATPALAFGPGALIFWALRRHDQFGKLIGKLAPTWVIAPLIEETSLDEPLRPSAAVMIDMVGSTAFQAQHGAGVFGDTQKMLYESLSTAVAAAGGEMVKMTGDGALAMFFSLDARRLATGAGHLIGDRAIAARAAHRAVQDFISALRATNSANFASGAPPIAVRIGADVGEGAIRVSQTSGRIIVDAIGEHINIAARLEVLAQRYEDGAEATVLYSSQMAALLDAGAEELKCLGQQKLKGVSQPLGVHRLLA